MNFQALQKSVRQARTARNILACSSVMLFGINGLLAYEIFSQSNQVILVPTNVSDGMIARGSVDKRYLEALALDAVYGLYNANPEINKEVPHCLDCSTVNLKYCRCSIDAARRSVISIHFPNLDSSVA